MDRDDGTTGFLAGYVDLTRRNRIRRGWEEVEEGRKIRHADRKWEKRGKQSGLKEDNKGK